MTPTEIADLLVVEIKNFVDGRIAKLKAELAAEQEAAGPDLRYQGVWQRTQRYRRGTIVTYKDVLWYCVSLETEEPPGTSNAWQLMVKTAR